MGVLEALRLNYIRASYAQAEAEGKLPQWFLKQFLFWLLRVLITLLVVFPIKLLLIVPIKLIWKYSGRGKNGWECGTATHLIRFVLFTAFYLCLLGGFVHALLNSH